jgi:hypothetical protein
MKASIEYSFYADVKMQKEITRSRGLFSIIDDADESKEMLSELKLSVRLVKSRSFRRLANKP